MKAFFDEGFHPKRWLRFAANAPEILNAFAVIFSAGE
jgi:hypothetical protein